MRSSKEEYFVDPWNINDLLLLALYVIYIIIGSAGEEVLINSIKAF
jgi:hypothetical protein